MTNITLIFLVPGLWAFLPRLGRLFTSPPRASPPRPDYNYLIGPLDTLSIIVWRNPDLSTTVPVRPDGKVSVPLVEDLPAQGKNPDAARARHREGDEQVHPRSGGHGARHAVQRPLQRADPGGGRGDAAAGARLSPNMTLLDVMIAVGGLTDFADGNSASVLRTAEGGQTVLGAPEGPHAPRRRLGQHRDEAGRRRHHPAKLVLSRNHDHIRPAIVRDALRGMWQGRWAGLAVAWLAAVAGSVFIFLTPDKYEATARVYVDTQSVLKPLLHGLTVQPNVEQEVAILSRTLISRPNLQKLVRMTDLDLNVKTQEEREKLIDGLSRTVYIKSAAPQPLHHRLRRSGPGSGDAGRAVAALHLRRVRPRAESKGRRPGPALHRGADQALRAAAVRGGKPPEGIQAEEPRPQRAAGRDFFGRWRA